MKLNLGSGAHPLDGFVNLTPPDWHFQDGLGQYEDGSAEGISISHAAMYLPLDLWPAAFSEFARVLKTGGVIRITEDATDDVHSERYGGFHAAVTLTSAVLVADHMARAGLTPAKVPSNWSAFRDDSLIQTWHGAAPKVFHVEGVKP